MTTQAFPTPTNSNPKHDPNSDKLDPLAPNEDGFPDEAPVRKKHVIDRIDGAFGLFVLRIVVAAIMGIRGLQVLQHLDVTKQQFVTLGIPAPQTMAIVVGAVDVAIAVALVLGLLVRLAGLGIAVICIAALFYVNWRTGAPIFVDGQPGFGGELELLLAAVGVAFIGLGGGGWGLDRRFRRR